MKKTYNQEYILLRRKLLTSLLTFSIIAVLLVFIFIYITPSLLAWFSAKGIVNANGMKIEAANDRVIFGNIIKVSRYTVDDAGNRDVSEFHYYKRLEFGNNTYFEIETTVDGDGNEIYGDFKTDENGNRIPIQLNGLFPNEYIDIDLSFKKLNGVSENGYKIFLSDLVDSDPNMDIDGRFTYNGKTYSAFGVYKVFANDIDKGYIVSYDGNKNEYVADSDTQFEIVTGRWNENSESQINIKITLLIDTEQYENIFSSSSNDRDSSLLADKNISIGKIYLEPCDIE